MDLQKIKISPNAIMLFDPHDSTFWPFLGAQNLETNDPVMKAFLCLKGEKRFTLIFL